MKTKKGIGLLGVAVIVVFVLLAASAIRGGALNFLAASPTGATTSASSSGSDNSVCTKEDVTFRYNDKDLFNIGTDPAGELLFLDGALAGTKIADDGSLSVSTDTKGRVLLGNGSVSYFSDIVDYDTDCRDPYDFGVDNKLPAGGGPTITIINDDGVTKNTDANHQAFIASDTRTLDVTVRAPADKCASWKNGAVVVIEGDNSYHQSVDSSLDKATDQILLTHNGTNGFLNGTGDAFYSFDFPGELCDSAKDTFTITVKTGTTTPTEDNTNLGFYWLPRDVDKDEKDLSEIIGLYDESNNELFDDAGANKSATIYGGE